MNLKADKIKRIEDKLLFHWSNGEECTLPLNYLRDKCPCAQCTSADEKKSKLEQWVQTSLQEFRNKLEKIELIGNYAIKLVWADGHDTGLYRWDYLYELCQNYSKNEG